MRMCLGQNLDCVSIMGIFGDGHQSIGRDSCHRSWQLPVTRLTGTERAHTHTHVDSIIWLNMFKKQVGMFQPHIVLHGLSYNVDTYVFFRLRIFMENPWIFFPHSMRKNAAGGRAWNDLPPRPPPPEDGDQWISMDFRGRDLLGRTYQTMLV